MDLDLNYIPYTEVFSKCIISLNIKHKIVEVLFFKKSIGENVCNLGLGEEFLDLT